MDTLTLALVKKSKHEVVVSNTDYITNRRVNADFVCTGVNDDEKIQAAIDLVAGCGGGTVTILPGIYTLHNNIEMKSNVCIKMEPGAKLKIMDQVRTLLTSDLMWDSYNFTVEDASGFKEGMRIGLVPSSDVGYITGYYATIESIEGKTITLKHESARLTRKEGENLLVSNGASIISFFSAIVTQWEDENMPTNNWSIIGGEIDGNKQNNPTFLINKDRAYNGINFFTSSNIRIQDVKIHDFQFQGIHPIGRDSRNIIIENCDVYNCWTGICCDSIDYGPVMISNCRCVNNVVAGVQLIDVNYAMVLGGYYSNNKWGIAPSYAFGIVRHTKISGATIIGRGRGGAGTSSTDACIFLNNSYGAIVTGCFLANSVTGIRLHNESGHISSYNIINDCFITECEAGIVEVANSNYNVLSNILLDGTCTSDLSLTGPNTVFSYIKNGVRYDG